MAPYCQPVMWASPVGAGFPRGGCAAVFALSGDVPGVLVVHRVLLTEPGTARPWLHQRACWLRFFLLCFQGGNFKPSQKGFAGGTKSFMDFGSWERHTKGIDRSFSRKWATCPEGAWGRNAKVWCPACGHWGRQGQGGVLPCLYSAFCCFFQAECDSCALLLRRLYQNSGYIRCHISAWGEGSGFIQPDEGKCVFWPAQCF